VQVDEEYTRLHAWSAIWLRNRPSINGDDVVAFFDELGPQKRAFWPLGAEQNDVRRLRFHVSRAT
jgi:hypothetical protein